MRMMRVSPCDEPSVWPRGKASRPRTRCPRWASWYAAALPMAPRPTMMTSYGGSLTRDRFPHAPDAVRAARVRVDTDQLVAQRPVQFYIAWQRVAHFDEDSVAALTGRDVFKEAHHGRGHATAPVGGQNRHPANVQPAVHGCEPGRCDGFVSGKRQDCPACADRGADVLQRLGVGTRFHGQRT